MDGIHEAAQRPPGRHDLVEHTPTRVHDESETHRLILARVEVGERLGHVLFIHDKVFGSESGDVATIPISDRYCDQLGRPYRCRLRTGRHHCLLHGWLGSGGLRARRYLQHLLACRDWRLQRGRGNGLLWCGPGALPAFLLGLVSLSQRSRHAPKWEEYHHHNTNATARAHSAVLLGVPTQPSLYLLDVFLGSVCD